MDKTKVDEVEELIRKHMGAGEVAKYRKAISGDESTAFLQWVNKRPYSPSQIVTEWIRDAWRDACAWQREYASTNRLTDEQILAIAWKYHYDEPDASGYDFGTPSLLEFARAIIAATEAK